MAKFYNKQKYGKGKRNRKGYTNAEKIAFRLGQEQRVRQSLQSKKDSRVYDAFSKGYHGKTKGNSKKPLFGI